MKSIFCLQQTSSPHAKCILLDVICMRETAGNRLGLQLPLWDHILLSGTQLSLLQVVDNSQDAHLLLGCIHILILFLCHSGAKAI